MCLAPQGRKKIAQGVSPGLAAPTESQPRRGETKACTKGFCRPSGAKLLSRFAPRACALGYSLSPLRGFSYVFLACGIVILTMACREETQPTTTETKPVQEVVDTPDRDIPRLAETPKEYAPTTQQHPVAATDSAPTEMARLTPLQNATVGDWALYQMLGDQRMALRMVGQAGREVTLEVEMIIDSKPLVLPAVRNEPRDLNRPRQHALRVKAQLTVTQERIEAAGRRWNVRRLDAVWTDEEIHYRRTTWIAEDAPIYGVVRMIQTADNEPVATMKLIEFGKGGNR